MARRREYVLATKASKFRPVMMTAGEERLQLVAATNLQRLHAHLSNTERLQLAAFIAGGFMAMLRSWIGRAMRDTPEEVQLYFEQFCDALLSGHPR